MATHRSARARAREQITAEVLAEARRQLARDGPAGLSLRSVARELGMVSSAVYRYVASRDELLTRLIVAAFDSIGEWVEQAVAAESTPTGRWLAAARAFRGWAIEHPHEYALVYGTPVPGYAAPSDTVEPGTRVSRALLAIAADAAASPGGPVPPGLVPGFDEVRRFTRIEVDDELLIEVIGAWTQLIGLVSAELFGHTTGMVSDHAALLDEIARRQAQRLGLG